MSPAAASAGVSPCEVGVLSLENEPGLVDAVDSPVGQRRRPEIVVVNGGPRPYREAGSGGARVAPRQPANEGGKLTSSVGAGADSASPSQTPE